MERVVQRFRVARHVAEDAEEQVVRHAERLGLGQRLAQTGVDLAARQRRDDGHHSAASVSDRAAGPAR